MNQFPAINRQVQRVFTAATQGRVDHQRAFGQGTRVRGRRWSTQGCFSAGEDERRRSTVARFDNRSRTHRRRGGGKALNVAWAM